MIDPSSIFRPHSVSTLTASSPTGAYYGGAFAEWVRQALQYADRYEQMSGSENRSLLPFTIEPLAVLKQVATMILAVARISGNDAMRHLRRFVLVPFERWTAHSNTVGLTTKEQPTLYWFISKPSESKVEVGLTPLDESGKEAGDTVELVLPGPKEAGIHRLDLSKAKDLNGSPVKLDPDTRYRWAVIVLEQDLGGSTNPSTATRLARVGEPVRVILGDETRAEITLAWAGGARN